MSMLRNDNLFQLTEKGPGGVSIAMESQLSPEFICASFAFPRAEGALTQGERQSLSRRSEQLTAENLERVSTKACWEAPGIQTPK